MSERFSYRDSQLYVEKLAVSSIAEEFGTPLYIYSKETILQNFHAYENAFRKISHLICFAVKSNSQHGILRLLADQGSGADIVSGGELFRALRAGILPNHVVFAGVGKTPDEIEAALRAKILLFNAESQQELVLINRIASQNDTIARVSLRLNPDVDAHTHPHIATGRDEDKFGIPMKDALPVLSDSKGLANIRICGLHMHLGSQISSARPYETAFRRVKKFMEALPFELEFLDIGGGAAIRYQGKDQSLKPEKLAKAILRCWPERKWKIILEPGRSIVGSAGILITKVLYRKKHFAIVDAGMNDLIRPALYDAYHEIIPVNKSGRKSAIISIAGPVCESADFLGKRRRMENPQPGDFLAILDCGGYGSSMSSQYNSRPRAAEVIVDGNEVHLIRHRESYEDLIRNEV